MKILYISLFFEPEHIAGAFRAAEHSRIWVRNGAEVTILTGWPNYPTGKVFDGYVIEMLAEEDMDGVRVLRSKISAKPNTSFSNRIQNGVSFLWYGLRNMKTNSTRIGDDYDVVLATSGPVFAGYLGYRIAKRMGKPFVIEYRDLTYAQLVASGSSETSFKCRVMKGLELVMARKAAHVVVLTNSFKKILGTDGVDPSKIDVVPNGADLVDLPHFENSGLVFGYFGTLGLSQAIPETIATLSALNVEGRELLYLIIGEGAAKGEVEAVLAEGEYGFAELLNGMSRDDLERYFAKIDMSVVSLRRSDSLKGFIPSKIFQSWARGIPVLFIGPDGEAAEMIRSYDLGLTLCGMDEENIKALCAFFAQPDVKKRLRDMGERAKSVMAANYTRERLAARMLGILERQSERKQG